MKDKLLSWFTILLFLGGLGTVGWVFISSYLLKKELTTVGELSCVTGRVEKAVDEDLVKEDSSSAQRFEILIGYYKCNPVRRGELVYYRQLPPMESVVRRVQAIPGDRFEVLEAEKSGIYQIKINGQFVKSNSENFYFSNPKTPPLRTFELARKGILGANEFILLSDHSPGGSDSTTMGVIKHSALLGKAAPQP